MPALQRLTNRVQFQAVLAGCTVARTPHFALHRLASDVNSANPIQPKLFTPNEVWIGVMLPKRWARRAVTRNAIKRQVYAVSQQFDLRLLRAAHVVRLHREFDRNCFVSASSGALKTAVRSELQQLFERASNKARPT